MWRMVREANAADFDIFEEIVPHSEAEQETFTVKLEDQESDVLRKIGRGARG